MKKEVEKKNCPKCKKDKDIKMFYNTKNPLFVDGLCPICSDCFLENIDINNIDLIKENLQQLNTPFLEKIWNKALESKRHPFSAYMTIVNSLPQYKNKTWKDSDKEGNIKYDNDEKVYQYTNKNNFKVTDEILNKWGEGYTAEHYKLFEKKYNKLINNYGEKTSLHTENLLVYIRFRVQEEMASARKDVREAKEWGQLAQKAAQDAKINVSQLSKSDISGGVDLVCQLFEAVESEVGIIPLLPKLIEQPYDDVDFIIWCIINYQRRLEDKSSVNYRDIWNFYDQMLEDYCVQNRMTKEQIEEYKKKRNNVFKDLGEIYKEPLYEESD